MKRLDPCRTPWCRSTDTRTFFGPSGRVFQLEIWFRKATIHSAYSTLLSHTSRICRKSKNSRKASNDAGYATNFQLPQRLFSEIWWHYKYLPAPEKRTGIVYQCTVTRNLLGRIDCADCRCSLPPHYSVRCSADAAAGRSANSMSQSANGNRKPLPHDFPARVRRSPIARQRSRSNALTVWRRPAAILRVPPSTTR